MPHSLVLNLLPKTAIPTNHLNGLNLHALFLELVRSLNPDLATHLHHQTADKAFTLSPLQIEQSPRQRRSHDHLLQWQHRHSIPAGIPCWWRIALLDETLFGSLTHLWLGISPHHPWHLGPTELQVARVLGTPQADQPWVNYAPYSQLYEQASDQERQIDLVFCTPTTFRQGRYDCALPSRESVFKSLLKRWNKYSPQPFPESLIEPIFPGYFNINTEIVQDNRSKFIGYVGTISFQILGNVDSQTIKQINALADFACYAGVGRKTPMGMGMVRRMVANHRQIKASL